MQRLLNRTIALSSTKSEQSWTPVLLFQIDTDADLTKKGGCCHFSYKGHIVVDIGSKLIQKICFTPVSPHDSTLFVELISMD